MDEPREQPIFLRRTTQLSVAAPLCVDYLRANSGDRRPQGMQT